MKHFVFSLDNDYIFVDIKKSISEVHCCDKARIILFYRNCEYILSEGSLRESLFVLSSLLKKALANQLQLDPSIETSGPINKDIGYLYNEHCQQLFNEYITNRAGLSYVKNERDKNIWIGYAYRLWCYDLQSWIYNDQNGNIIFELSPLYTTNYVDQEKEYAILYEQWLKSYSPFLIRIIPRDIAQNWLNKAEHILAIIEKNVKSLIAEGKL